MTMAVFLILFCFEQDLIASVRPEIVGFGSGQGLSVFATEGVAVTPIGGILAYSASTWMATPLLQKGENAALGQKMLFPDKH